MIQLTNSSIEGTERNRTHNKPCVPIVSIVDCSNTQKHEDNGFRRRTEHLHSILDCSMRFVGNVGFHIVLHGYPTESDPMDRRHKSQY